MTLRQQLEERERSTLSPHAALAAESKGRAIPEEEHAYRTAFQRDRDRIIHTKAFRRLKEKTQVFLAPEGDHYRTRLTHTLEVAQIARTVSRSLFLNEDLTEAVALGHDLGHTPFGHAGEFVLNEVLEGGFDHATQSVRIVEHLESTRHGQGLNLTKEVRDGILQHSRGKGILLGTPVEGAGTLEGDIVSICDAIAYINHDIDDAIRAGIAALDQFPQAAIERLGETPSERIDAMVLGVIDASGEGEIGMAEDAREATLALRRHLYEKVYPSEPIDSEIRKAKKLLRELYFHLLLNPTDESAAGNPSDSLERRTADFVAGMTDHYALQLYEQLLLPSAWHT